MFRILKYLFKKDYTIGKSYRSISLRDSDR